MPEDLTSSTGPLPIPRAPRDSLIPVVARLRGHTTSANWLPVGLDDAVDEFRERQLAQRERTASAIADLAAAQVTFATEDYEFAEGLRDAQRTGKTPKDRRTAPADRERALSDLRAVQWASIEVMAEIVQEAVDALREAEPRILSGLRAQADEGDARIRAAEQEVRRAQEAHFVLLRTGLWLKAQASDGPYGGQPAPVVGPVPPGISRDAVAGALERRRWHEQPNAPVAA